VGILDYFFNPQKNKIGRILKKYFVLTLLRPKDIGPAMLLIKQEIKTTVTQGSIYQNILAEQFNETCVIGYKFKTV
jgi:hypothetical protein